MSAHLRAHLAWLDPREHPCFAEVEVESEQDIDGADRISNDFGITRALEVQ